MTNYTHESYFPNEAFDPEPRESSEKLVSSSKWRQEVRREYNENTSTDAERRHHERELAFRIQAGIAARAEISDELNEERRSELVACIADSEEAREELFRSNLLFAHHMARLSMNIDPLPSSENGAAWKRRHERPTKHPLGDIRKIAHPHAKLEDREQVAAMALWESTEKFVPRFDKDGSPSGGRFVNMASYAIHDALKCHMIEKESNGWYVSRSVMESVREDEKRLEQGIDQRPGHLSASGRREGNHPTIVRAGQQAIAYEELDATLNLRDNSEEESGSTHLLSIDEYISSDRPSPENEMLRNGFRGAIETALSMLSPREAGVIALRFGLGEDDPKTFDEIGKVYGVTRERVRQIERKAMAKLRDPENSVLLADFLDEEPREVLSYELSGLVDGVSNIKSVSHLPLPGQIGTEPERVKVEVESAPQSRQESLESVSEEWDAPMRTQTSEHDERTRTVYDMHMAIMQNRNVFNNNIRDETIIGIVDQLALKSTKALDIAYFWNDKSLEYIKMLERMHGDDFSLNHVSKFFSRLLERTLTVEDEISLTIPKEIDGKLNHFLAGVTGGTIAVKGNVGDNFAERAGGAELCSIHLQGSAGDWVANRAKKGLNIVIDGNMGDYGAANIAAQDCAVTVHGDAGSALGDNSKNGNVVVIGEVKSVHLQPNSKLEVQAGYIHASRIN